MIRCAVDNKRGTSTKHMPGLHQPDAACSSGGELVTPFKLLIVVKWDVYHRPYHRPDLLYNHFRIDTCNSVDGGPLAPQCVQDWYNQVQAAGDMVDQWLISDEVYGAQLQPDPVLGQELSQNTCTPQQPPPSHHQSNTGTPLHSSGSNAKRSRPSSTGTVDPLVSGF